MHIHLPKNEIKQVLISCYKQIREKMMKLFAFIINLLSNLFLIHKGLYSQTIQTHKLSYYIIVLLKHYIKFDFTAKENVYPMDLENFTYVVTRHNILLNKVLHNMNNTSLTFHHKDKKTQIVVDNLIAIIFLF